MSASSAPAVPQPGRRLAVVTVALVAAAMLVNALGVLLLGRVSTLGIPTLVLLSAVRSVVIGVLALVATVTGVLATVQPARRSLLAAAGLGAAVVLLVGVVSGLVLPLLANLLIDRTGWPS